MHERERVDQLYRRSRRIEQLLVDGQAFTRCINEQGTNAFAAIENGVAHGVVQASR